MYYILKNKRVKKASLEEFSLWFNKESLVVKQESLPNGKYISTVFLGIDYNFAMSPHKPLLFETMVFTKYGNFEDIAMVRYSTWGEAIRGHKLLVKKFKHT